MSPNLKGILLMLGSMAVFTALDSCAKLVMQTLDPSVAVFFRYFMALLFSLLVLWRAGGIGLLSTQHPVLQALRGLLLLASTGLNFIGIYHLQLAQTAAISFTIPLWVCALSVPLLGEHVGLRRWAAVAVGFLGILVIMRPGSQSFHWAMLFSLGAALMGGLYNIATRKVGGRDQSETSLFYVCLFGSLGGLLPLPWHWQTPQGHEWVLLAIMGLAGAMGHYLLIQAHRLASAALLAPFIYTQIVWMIIAGYLLFNALPDGLTLLGAAIVIASGIYVFARERTLGKSEPVPAPVD